MNHKNGKKRFSDTVSYSVLLGIGLAILFTFVGAFFHKSSGDASAITAILFLLIILVVVCTGVITTRIDRARGEILSRLDELEHRPDDEADGNASLES